MNMKRLAFSDPMYLAFLQGRKTQTRRIIKFPKRAYEPNLSWIASVNPDGKGGWIAWGPKPVDDETSRRLYPNGGGFHSAYLPGETVAISAAIWRGRDDSIRYNANGELASVKSWQWENNVLAARFCPLWCCQHTAKIVSVRVERVREISEADAVAEGVTPSITFDDIANRAGFVTLWDTLHPQPGENWESNPWVFVYEFVKVS